MNIQDKKLFFCGVGGSGMMPLALICQARGACVYGSDRSYDQGKTPDKFESLKAKGIKIFPQDGSGISDQIDSLIVSSAVEASIPDVKVALDIGVPIQKRADLLALLFNVAEQSISIAGTSGKSTVTGMSASIYAYAGLEPTVMNGGVIRNFESAMCSGQGGVFITETDESDGSIALYNPSIAVVNNIALDHKSLEELDQLFGDFIARTKGVVVLNADDKRVMALADKASCQVISFSVQDHQADLFADNIEPLSDGIRFDLQGRNVCLNVPGEHNVMNALAAIGTALAGGISLDKAIEGIQSFEGIKRRLEIVGTSQSGVTVIDDFGHNPDKIAAGLKTLKQAHGRLFVMFQPHGYGPMRLMGNEIANSFAEHLSNDDFLYMTQPYYAGGTTEKDETVRDIVHALVGKNVQARFIEDRSEFLLFVKQEAKSGDRVVIMGARDDTLSVFAKEILESL